MANVTGEVWYERAADLMARKGYTLRQALAELGEEGITAEEAKKIEGRKGFHKTLWAARRRLYQELHDDPRRTKQNAIGRMEFLIIKLCEEGEWEKAVDAQVKQAKLEGWMDAEAQVNVFQGLSDHDYKQIRDELKRKSEIAQASKPVEELAN